MEKFYNFMDANCILVKEEEFTCLVNWTAILTQNNYLVACELIRHLNYVLLSEFLIYHLIIKIYLNTSNFQLQ